MNRALRAATMGVLLLSPLAISACSAGQVTQTATQERDKTGAQAHVGDIVLREGQLAYPSGDTYEAGDDAELNVAIVNGGETPDTLTGVEGTGFGGADISDDKIKIPANDSVFVGEDDVSITLTDLDKSLTTGQTIQVTFTFDKAGDVTVPVSVANPPRALKRGEDFDFNKEQATSGEVASNQESANDN